MSLGSENCYPICIIPSEDAKKKSFFHEDLCLSKQLPFLFILYWTCFVPWFMPENQNHSAYCVNKSHHSCSQDHPTPIQTIQSRYMLQIPQKPPQKTETYNTLHHSKKKIIADTRKNADWPQNRYAECMKSYLKIQIVWFSSQRILVIENTKKSEKHFPPWMKVGIN